MFNGEIEKRAIIVGLPVETDGRCRTPATICSSSSLRIAAEHLADRTDLKVRFALPAPLMSSLDDTNPFLASNGAAVRGEDHAPSGEYETSECFGERCPMFMRDSTWGR